MNIELKPRTISFLVPAPASPNDNADQWRDTAPPRLRVIIYKPAKSAMTSGRADTKRWVLKFEPQSPPFIEPLMGWTGSTDPMAQMRLTFPTREAAVAYAQRQRLNYEVREAAKPPKTFESLYQPKTQPRNCGPSGRCPAGTIFWSPKSVRPASLRTSRPELTFVGERG